MALPDQVKIAYSEGYDFGIGVNYASGGPKNKAVTGEVSTVEVGGGDIVGYQITRVMSSAQIEKALEISVEADYGISAFAGASARLNFAQNAKVQSSSLVMMVSATVKRAFRQIDKPQLTDLAIADATNAALFDQRYGNMFIRGINSGGLFVGCFRLDTGSEQMSTDIAAELSGSYGLFSAEAEVKFREVQQRFRSSLTVSMYHEGGPVDLHIDSIDQPLELLRNMNLFLESFQSRPDQVAIPYSVTMAPMVIAHGSPEPLNEIDLQHAQDVLIFCAKRRTALIDQMNTYQFIADNPSRFKFENGASLREMQDASSACQLDLDLIARCASRAMNRPGEAKLPEPFSVSVGEDYPKAFEPAVMPTAVPLVVAPNAMPNFVGRPADPVISLLSCINMEGIDHCLNFLGASLDVLGDDKRRYADFFFLVLRSGTQIDVRGDASVPGAVVRSQFPPAGVEVTSTATMMFEV